MVELLYWITIDSTGALNEVAGWCMSTLHYKNNAVTWIINWMLTFCSGHAPLVSLLKHDIMYSMQSSSVQLKPLLQYSHFKMSLLAALKCQP